MPNFIRTISKNYSTYLPIFFVVGAIITYIFLRFVFHSSEVLTNLILFVGIFAGSIKLFASTIHSISKLNFGLDYIAILAIIVSIITGQYIVALIVVLMLTGGETLEEYAQIRARKSMQQLANRLPDVVLRKKGNKWEKVKISNVKKKDIISVRKGEVIPLDGLLHSEKAFLDESAMTGEPFFEEKIKGDVVRSGTVNKGDVLEMTVTKEDSESTFRKIIELVKSAQEEKSPMLRLTDKYNVYFTIVSLIIAIFSFVISGFDFQRVLAVLVIATPCPLILATPVALIGGVNSAASGRMIVKNLIGLETLAKLDAIIFDKTGTLTFGQPRVSSITLVDKKLDVDKVLAVAASIERASLHPFAKAIVLEAQNKKLKQEIVENIGETIGSGIQGTVNGKVYKVQKSVSSNDSIELLQDEKLIAVISFEDIVKEGTKEIINRIIKMGIDVFILSGDHHEKVDKFVKNLNIEGIEYYGDFKPEDKRKKIEELKFEGKTVGMVGDGINDAPALALADIGIVFANEEQTISSEVADVLFLGGDINQVHNLICISRKTIGIAKQSIIIGLTLSTVGMIFAAFGFIVPILGAIIQESIDVAVILNGLRSSMIKIPSIK